jgi:GNAT superfamily N-acetyltransferase
MKSPKVKLRKAGPDDMSAVHALISELAHYERAPMEVSVTVEELKHDGYVKNMFEVTLAEAEGEVVGMAFYYPRYSTWKGKCIYLEDFIVKIEFRHLGIGKMLFDQVVRYSHAFGAKRLEWQVLNWNELALNFYKKVGAELDDEWINGRMTDTMIEKYIQGK